MGDSQNATNAGEQVANSPTGLGLSSEAQFRTLSQRIDTLTAEIAKAHKPPTFRLADSIEIIGIIIGLIVGGLTAFGLSERINDVNAHQADAERRLESRMDGIENRIGNKIDKLSDQFTKMDERTSTLEGKLSNKAPNQP